MSQETEDQSQRIIQLAKREIYLKTRKIERERIIDVRFEPIVDMRGCEIKKMHRVRVEMDLNYCMNVEFDIADYRTAEDIRVLAE
jgi:hypothetical protein